MHDNLEGYGTGGYQALSDDEIREAIAALTAVLRRLGFADFRLPFRDYVSFRSWWIRQDAARSWQARRDLLDGLFDALHGRLAALEQAALASSLADPISPHQRTGWAAVDMEIGELRRHFESADAG